MSLSFLFSCNPRFCAIEHFGKAPSKRNCLRKRSPAYPFLLDRTATYFLHTRIHVMRFPEGCPGYFDPIGPAHRARGPITHALEVSGRSDYHSPELNTNRINQGGSNGYNRKECAKDRRCPAA